MAQIASCTTDASGNTVCVPSKASFHNWRVLAGFWLKKAGASRVSSLISACAAWRMLALPALEHQLH